MANYINSEILAEAYTHLDTELFRDKGKLDVLKSELTKFFHERASFLFGTDVVIQIQFEEGSLKTKIVAIGSVAATLMAAVGPYGDFRQSVGQLANDAVGLAQAANMEVIFRTKTPYCDRLRVEKRKGVFGRVVSLLVELDAVGIMIEESKLPTNNVRLRDANAAIDALLHWEIGMDKLFSKFENPETVGCVAEGLETELKKLPRSFLWQSALVETSLQKEIIDSNPNFSGQVAATAARYSASLNSIEKNLRIRIAQRSIHG